MMNDDQGYAYGEYVNDLATYMKDATTYMMGYMSQKDLRNGIDSAHLDAEATARAFERSAKNMANRSGSGAGAKRAVWDAAAKQAGGWADEARNSGSVDAFWKKMDSALKPFAGKMGAYGLALDAASLAEAYQDGKSNEVLKELAKIGSGIVIGALVTMSLAGAWPAYAVAGAIWVGSLAVGELIDAYWPDIDNDVAHNFLRGKGVRNNDPLALDLDGDGLETSRFWGWNNLVTFDHNADRIKTGTGWLDADDGWLVLDRNGNGLIDSGRELFGDNTLLSDGSKASDGFEALAQQDSNGDGKIDASDSVYLKLRVWQDLNQDGVSQDNELKSQEELGVDSLGTNGKKTDIPLGNLNHLVADGEFTRSDGSNDLLIDLFGDSGSIRVSGWYRGDAYHVGRIETADGVLEHTRVEQLVKAMAAFSPPAGSELTFGGQREDQLQPVIAAAWEAA
jgi:hypothetical protein